MVKLVQGSSSSSLSYDHSQRYDVFISFRGADTRLSFTDHLYKALVHANLNTFIDDQEIETGQDLKPELENAIKSSRSSVIILSKNYASSTWCLDELVLILNQRLISGHIVVPIFYHVEPTHVRKQQNSFGCAMANHKHRMETEINVEKRLQWARKMDRWTKALTQVADLKGMDVNGRLETDFIDEIVTNVYRRLGGPLTKNLPFLCGMENSIRLITSWLRDGSSHTMDILTIVGMGGIGKTTIARHLHALHYHLFDRSSFVEGIGTKCASQGNALFDLQKQLCSDILRKNPLKVDDSLAYTAMIENALSRKKAFIVLDDIDNVKQLNALLGRQGLYPGSKVIVTTRDVSLIDKYATINLVVQPKHTNHLLKGLDKVAALQLLSHHAFMRHGPPECYKAVSEKLSSYCEGHPLALQVLGESLHNRDVCEWEERIDSLKEETNSHINKVLQMSFDSLPSRFDKELFKHIACFFVEKDRVLAETVLKACGMKAISGIRNLSDRCLLSIDWNNKLVMHQLLQDMGRDLVRQESPDKPEDRSRLWCHEESLNVLQQNKGTGNTKGLILIKKKLENEQVWGSDEIKTEALSKLDNLMILQLNYMQLTGAYKNFPKKIRWLCLNGFPLKAIPPDLPMDYLVALDMSYSSIQSFGIYSRRNPQPPEKKQKVIGSCSKGERILGSLKILNLSFCEQLQRIGGFLGLPALERLLVRSCISLTEISESLEECVDIVHIDLSYCNKLEKLPTAISKLKKVQTLLIDDCNIRESQIDTNLKEMLVPNNIHINSPTSSSSTILEYISGALNFSMISFPNSLVRLSLANNNLSNESFPMDLSSMSLLKYLCLDRNPIVYMPSCVRSLHRLEELSMEQCEMLISIEHPPCTLRRLNIRQPNQLHSLQRIVIDTEMSPLTLSTEFHFLQYSPSEIEGMENIQPTGKKLRTLGGTTLDFIKKRRIGTCNFERGSEGSQSQMYLEFGKSSTIYGGKEMSNWIKPRSKGSSISFRIPSSPRRMLRGLNVCHTQRKSLTYDSQLFELPVIRISNKTKNRTWIYKHCIDDKVNVGGKWLIFISHWMFGINEMEAGDEITINVTNEPFQVTKKYGVRVVYHDGSMEEEEEEDVLEYCKSWNHIITW